jgi:putative oxidoreductase
MLRLAAGFSLLWIDQMSSELGATMLLLRWVFGAVALLLWVGLWTPVAAVIEAVIQIGIMTLEHRYDASLLVAAAVGLALAMLGPGAWSLDARFFGRKRIV